MIKFGPWSTLLAIGAAYGASVAVLLCATRRNRTANRLLAGLIGVIVLKLMPYVLGFAGFYDTYPWLSFAPFGLGLAIGPLLYLHVHRLTGAALPRRWGWHLAPAALQLLYGSVLFVQPLAVKTAWNDHVHARWIDPAEVLAVLLSVAVYWGLAVRRYRGYQRWLDDHLSNREEYRLDWLRRVLVAIGVLLAVWVPFELWSYAAQFSYAQRFPLYVALTVLIYGFGIEGWRHADQRYPLPAASAADTALAPPAVAAGAPRRGGREPEPADWAALGTRWQQQLAEAGWWRDPSLSLAQLARHLGTNTNYLSRALNDGLGLSFNQVVNGLRVEAVAAALRAAPGAADAEGAGLLQLAFEAGFSSKTSFNRVFKAHAGVTPTAYRALQAAPAPVAAGRPGAMGAIS